MGRTDCAPTAEGITACVSQAAELAVETLIASDLSRARSAGEVLSAALHVPLTVDSRWRELDFGQWDGKATGDIDSEALGRFWADPDCYPQIGRAHVSTPVTNAHLVCRLLLEKKQKNTRHHK